MMLIVPAIIAFATSNIFGGVSGHCCSCPECGEECCPQPTTIKEKKHCWEVEMQKHLHPRYQVVVARLLRTADVRARAHDQDTQEGGIRM
jgi:hypothetical protein